MARRKFNQEEIDAMIKMYQDGATYGMITASCEVSEGGLLRVLHKHKLIGRGRSQTSKERCGRKWFWNFNFFNRQTPEAAYWAGFILADGSVVKTADGVRLSIELQSRDRHHLDTFCNHVGIDSIAIKDRWRMPNELVKSSRKSSYICLTHHNLLEHLLVWGVRPNKTYEPIKPQVDASVLRDFLRGWFDGDGNFVIGKRRESFQITGNKFMLDVYASALGNLGYDGSFFIESKPENVWGRLKVRGHNQVKKVFEILQADGAICLERKWLQAINHFGGSGGKTT
jgi:hypothetical protein